MIHQKTKSALSISPMKPAEHMDPSSERLGKMFVFTAVSGESFVDDEHQSSPAAEPAIEASYPTSWTWIGRAGDHRP